MKFQAVVLIGPFIKRQVIIILNKFLFISCMVMRAPNHPKFLYGMECVHDILHFFVAHLTDPIKERIPNLLSLCKSDRYSLLCY